jgi:murein DD-endopeptidase MepM/ murein hydrolase activator NlpD
MHSKKSTEMFRNINPLHPHQRLREKQRKKQERELLLKHPRNSTVFLSFVYLFMPMLLVVPSITSPAKSSLVVTGTNTYDSVIDGRGGPAYASLYTERQPISLKEIKLESDPRFVIDNGLSTFDKGYDGAPIITVTKTYNYLKVANTTMPVISPEVSSEYGWRVPPCDGCSADHKGVDFVPGNGTPVFAITDGLVIEMGKNGGYGNYIVLKHLVGNDEGVIEEWISLYAHLQNDSFPETLKIGSVVQTGETIGKVGNTGMSTGPHLHFELTINGEHVDPRPLLGTYKVLIVSGEEYEDYMFVGEKFKVVTTEVTYE